ncbi:MAG: sodium ion-translocating decarboxylase subunit beta [Spirochaetaceae bacterium]|nr:MAG: sodium ion-translocating decarboxylase subunit beta [Spirochaetaceae bacterium]
MSIGNTLAELWSSTGVAGLGPGQLTMIVIGLVLIYLAIAKKFEPLLLLPIGFGGILANIPFIGIAEAEGFIGIIYGFGIENGLFPLFIFIGVGALTDFGPLLANPRTALLGAAAQFGIFATLLGALGLGLIDGIDFTIAEAAAIGIIGGADGPTAIFLASRLSPRLLGSVAVAAYSYMALVPVIQPPIAKLLTTKAEREIKMEQLRHVTKTERILFPIVVLVVCIVLLPSATPLIGALMFGNLIKESTVTDRLSKAAQNELLNIVTILLGLAVGSQLSADKFLTFETLGIVVLGLVAFAIGTASGVLLAKIMNKFSRHPINPLIGAAGVSAVPMAARVANKLGQDANPDNHLLMHAMGPNVAGVIGSAVAAGVLLAIVPLFG